MSINIEVEGGKSVRLKTAGKYCDRDIVVTAKGGASGENKLAKVADKTITEITAEDLAGATNIGEYAFYYCQSLKSVTFPDSVTSIGKQAFNRAPLTHLNIPDNVKTIGDQAFYWCRPLTNVTIGNGVETIGHTAFYGAHVEVLTIGSGIKSIAQQGLYCEKLKRVTIYAATPPTIQNMTFGNEVPADCAFYVPPASVEAYKAATNWSARADYIFPIVPEKGEMIATYTESQLDTGIYGDDMPALEVGKGYYVNDTYFVADGHGWNDETGDVMYAAPPSDTIITTEGNRGTMWYDPAGWGVYWGSNASDDRTVTFYKAEE